MQGISRNSFYQFHQMQQIVKMQSMLFVLHYQHIKPATSSPQTERLRTSIAPRKISQIYLTRDAI